MPKPFSSFSPLCAPFHQGVYFDCRIADFWRTLHFRTQFTRRIPSPKLSQKRPKRKLFWVSERKHLAQRGNVRLYMVVAANSRWEVIMVSGNLVTPS